MNLDATSRIIVTAIRAVFLGITLANCLLLSAQPAVGDEPITLQVSGEHECLQFSTSMRANGKLLLEGDESPRNVPLHVLGRLDYYETIHGRSEIDAGVALRYYHEASAEIAVAGRAEKTTLSKTRRLVAVEQGTSGTFSYYSPLGPLTRDDLELVSVQCDPLLVLQLLPESPTRVGETWQPTTVALAGMLGLDDVTQADIECTLQSATDETAEIQIAGDFEGTALGAASKITIDGNLSFDRTKGRPLLIDMKINEKREIGIFAPGFEIEASIHSTVSEAALPKELSAEKLEHLTLGSMPSNTAIDFASVGMGLAFIHDRRWRVTRHQQDLLLMRMAHDGKFVAQCNISPLKSTSDEPSVELAKFRAHVSQTLASQHGAINEVSQATNEEGVDIIRIAAQGAAKELPLTYFYYLMTSQDGRRVAVIFTFASGQQERFGSADHDLIGALRFIDAEKAANREGRDTAKTR